MSVNEVYQYDEGGGCGGRRSAQKLDELLFTILIPNVRERGEERRRKKYMIFKR